MTTDPAAVSEETIRTTLKGVFGLGDDDPHSDIDRMIDESSDEEPDPLDSSQVNKWLYALRFLELDTERSLQPWLDEAARIAEGIERITAIAEGRKERLEQLCTSWHRSVLREYPKKKTIKLPGGTLAARARQVTVRADSTLLGMFFVEGDAVSEFVNVEPRDPVAKADIAKLKKAIRDGRLVVSDGVAVIADTGEVLSWVTVEVPSEADANTHTVKV